MANKQASTMLKVAMKFVGYREKLTNKDLDSFNANSGYNNWNKFAAYIDKYCPDFYNGKKNGYGWCNIFVDYCFIIAFGKETALELLCIPKKSSDANPEVTYKHFANKKQIGNDPKRGAIIVFGNNAKSISHIGIVYDFDDTYVYTVEGDTSQRVALRKYTRNNTNIFKYGYPKFDDEPESNFDDISKYIGIGDGESLELPIRPIDSPESDSVDDSIDESRYSAIIIPIELGLRKNPKYNCQVLVTLTKNTTVTVYDDSSNKDWAYVKYGEIYGYVPNKYIIKSDTDIQDPISVQNTIVKNTTNQPTEDDDIILFNGIVSTNSSVLNIRKGPGNNYPIIATLKNGSKVNICDINDGWYTIKLNSNSYGYAIATSIKKTK